ncbi:MAG: MYXO-CTERM sorting domain-containing protein [Myxococcota bacterium]
MVVLAALTAHAQTFQSEPEELLFEDTFDLFSFVSIDTGYLPSQSDPISVRFHVTPTGGVVTEMEAVSNMEWPTAFKHTVAPIPGEGLFGIDTSVDIEFEVYINVASIYQSSIPLWSEGFAITEGVAFDTLVLPGSPEYPLEVDVANQNLIDPFEYDFDVVPGIAGLSFQVEIYPQLSTTMGGNRIETVLAGSTGVQDGEGGFSLLDPPGGNPGEVFLESTYFADLSTSFDIVIRPSATLDTIIGDFELVAFDFPIELLSDTQTREFDSVVYTHPLPALEPIDMGTDVGVVEVGNLRNLTFPLRNLGAMGLEGTAWIEGSDAFSVWPQYFYATEGNTDGVVVTFEPEVDGEELATLVIESNDPVTPLLRIPLTGTGFDATRLDNPLPGNDPPNLSGEDVRGCGCASSPAPMWGALLLPALLAVRRRQVR